MLYVTYTLNFLLMLGMPFLLAAFLARRLRVRWGLFWVGTVTFIASQIVHIPLLRVLGQVGALKVATAGWPLVWYAVLLGLMAGVCEELARYLVLRFWLERDRSWPAALMFGAGHGGVESFIVGLFTAAGVTADKVPAVQAQLAAAWSVPVLYPLLGAFERATAISTHLFLAVLVMQAFTRHNILWLLAAILWHALTDAVAVYAASAWGVIPTEAAVAVLALIGLAVMFALRRPEPLPVVPAETPPPASGPPATETAPTADQLNRTRYQ
jgi:uncharacterized membrane protein YhfC